MPTAMTFTSLQEDLRRYLERGYVTDTTVYEQLPRLINNAERELAQDLKVMGQKVVYNSMLFAGVSTYLKPDRWRLTANMQYGVGAAQSRVFIYPRDLSYCRMYWPDPAQTGAPKFYADYDYLHWLVVPTPAVDYPWELTVYELIAMLDDVNQTNWWTEFASTTLLYRSLLECIPFLKEDKETEALWKNNYEGSKSSLNTQDLLRIIDNTTSRQRA